MHDAGSPACNTTRAQHREGCGMWWLGGPGASPPPGPGHSADLGRLTVIATQEDHASSVPSFLGAVGAVCPDFALFPAKDYYMVCLREHGSGVIRMDNLLEFAEQLRPFSVCKVEVEDEDGARRAVISEAAFCSARLRPQDRLVVLSSDPTARSEIARFAALHAPVDGLRVVDPAEPPLPPLQSESAE